MLSITAIEDLLMARIREQLPYLATVESYQGAVDEAALAEGRMPVLRVPAVLPMLHARPAAPGEYGAGNDDLTHNFRLVVVCRSLRGQEAARRDGQGAYQILEDLRTALSGYLLAAELQLVRFTGDEALFVTREWAAYAANYSILQEVDNV